jgi:hypothetical protein
MMVSKGERGAPSPGYFAPRKNPRQASWVQSVSLVFILGKNRLFWIEISLQKRTHALQPVREHLKLAAAQEGHSPLGSAGNVLVMVVGLERIGLVLPECLECLVWCLMV